VDARPDVSVTADAATASVLEGLFPGYFSLVMATGIVAIAAELQSVEVLADVLLAVGGAAYLVLAALFSARLVRWRARFVADLTSHAKGPAFLTIVAGTNVLGSATVVVWRAWTLGWVLWVLGLVLWVVVLYTVFTALLVREPKPPLEVGINGTWFLFAVATQSVAALGALLAPRLDDPDGLLFASLSMFLLGLFLYLVVVTVVFLRLTFVRLRLEETLPPYWIGMGAVAITALAGSLLYLDRRLAPLVDDLGPLIGGLTAFAWAVATFWIPVMLALGIWRHVVRRVPLRYDPTLWAMVFPLGMYSVATARMIEALDLGFLDVVADVAFVVALAAWGATLLGLAGGPVRLLAARTRGARTA